MQERLREQFKQIKERLAAVTDKLSKKAKIVISIIAVLVIAMAFVVALALNNKPMEVLYTGVDEAEAIEIIGVLEEQQVKYQRKDGTIYVTPDMVDKMKVALAAQGYPKSGFTYDLFINNVSLLATDFEKYKYAQFELESRMAATIRQFEGVKEATVALAMAEEQKYALQEDVKESSASVTVTMKDGGSPSKQQVNGIQILVARGVPGMKTENVAVVDGNGEEVSKNEDNTQEGSAALKLSLEKQIESGIKGKILNQFQPVFGDQNIRVSVTCSVDLDKKIKEIIQYIPSQDNRGVLSNSTSSYEVQGQGQVTAGVPGTPTNTDENFPVYPGVTTDGNDIYFKDDRALEYLVSQVKEQVQSDSGELTDTTVSVAVDSADLTPAKAGEMRQAIALAAGIDPAQAEIKIAIFNAPFYKEPPAQITGFNAILDANPMLKIIIPAVLALIIALIAVVLVILKKAKTKKRVQELAAEEAKRARDTDDLVQLDELGKSREEELKSQLQDFTDINPEISAQLLKTWLRGDDDNG